MISLARALGLKPLDRVQLNNAREVDEMRTGQRMGVPAELPFLFFQRELQDGRIELRSPGGYAVSVLPSEVCDVIEGQQILVRAMRRDAFIARQQLSVAERQAAPSDDCYAQAYVLYLMKDRWGRVDQVFVWFLDDKLNGDKPWAAPVHQDDARQLSVLRRTSLPIISNQSGAASADAGVLASADAAQRMVEVFVGAALRGEASLVRRVSEAGISPISRTAIAKLRVGMSVAWMS